MSRVSPKLVSEQVAAIACMNRVDLAELLQTLSGEDLPNWPLGLQRHLVAYRLQEQRYGGLPSSAKRLLSNALKVDKALKNPPVVRQGTRIIREWNGNVLSVLALPDGKYEWEGRTYRSLSKIAREVTGTQWSGPRFFGLVKRAA